MILKSSFVSLSFFDMLSFYLALALAFAFTSESVDQLAPIVFVPGLGGSVLEAQLSSRSKHRDCAQDADWYTLWFSEVQVLTRVSPQNRFGK